MPKGGGGHSVEPMNSSTVVAGYDGSDTSRAALTYAAALAGDGQLFVVCAMEHVGAYLGEPYAQRVLDREDERARGFEADIERLLPAGTDYETEMIEGPAAEAILRVAKTREADEIVIGSRGLGALKSALGSVSHELLKNADRPVVVIPAHAVVHA
jgi:nucleotide-binding universal stress UspA family protein